jgi:TolB-like protein/DNA-binding SARP family transcriptional activator/Tfp pilus assembly protein PilF
MNQPVRFRLHLLGRLELFIDDETTPTRLANRKARALLAYLAMSAGQAATREQLAALLWSNCSDQQARQSLRQSLLLLRKDLPRADFISSNSETVRLQEAQWRVDALEFEELAKSTLPHDLDRAAKMFAGDFAAGFHLEEEGFDEWVSAQRLRLQRAATRLCETFAARPDLVLDPEGAIAITERLYALDPLREDWQRLALILHARYRSNSEALSLGEQYGRMLQHELGEGPEQATLSLLADIRSGTFDSSASRLAREPTRALAEASEAVPPAIIGSSLTPQRRDGIARALAAASIMASLGVAGLVVLNYYQDRSHAPAMPAAMAEGPASTNSIQSSYWKSPSSGTEAEPSRGVIPIAILPFHAYHADDQPAGDNSMVLADLLNDDLINIVSRNKMFRVISRQTVRKFQDQQIDIDAIRAELRVRYILEGSVRVSGDTLRVNVALTDSASKAAIWSDRVERNGADRQGLQDEIVARLARELHLEIMPIESERQRNDPDAEALAYRGWAAMNVAFAKTSSGTFEMAERLFTQSLERDPQNLSAMVGLGAYHANVGAQVLDSNSAAHLDKAKQILSDVLTRAPSNGAAPFYLGLVHGASGRLDDALASFRRALEVNPSHAGAHAHVGHTLARMDRATEGLEHLHYALRLSPRDPNLAYWHEFIGSAEIALGHYPAAIESFDRSASLNPGYPRSWAGLSAAHALAGDMDAARKHADKLRTFAPGADTEALIRRFGRNKNQSPKLQEGLRLALAPVADSWQSPRLPSRTAAPATKKPSDITAIAVLPFTTFGDADAVTQQTADAVTNDLTNVLSRVPALRVISRQTMQSYAGQKADVGAIGSELGVRYVLEGNIRAHGEKLRVNVELTDPSTRQPIWTLRIDRDPNDVYGLQDEIVGRLGRELHYEIYRAESERTSANPSVRQTLFKGWNLIINHADFGLDRLDAAKMLFEQVLADEPGNLSAIHGIGWYHGLAGSLRLDAQSAAHLEQGEALIAETLRRAPNHSGAHFMMGLLLRSKGQRAEALEFYQRALEINPSFASAYAHIGHTLIQLGRSGEGLDQIRYALRLSPRDASRSHWLRFLGEGEAESGDLTRAIETLHHSYSLNPKQPLTLRALAAVHALAGNTAEARRFLVELKAAAPYMRTDRGPERTAREGMPSAMARGWRLALASAS